MPRNVKSDENVFIHLSFENYIPDYMVPEGKDTFVSIRMVPPGPLHYFYSINDEYFTSDKIKSKTVIDPIKTVIILILLKQKVELESGALKTIVVPKTNVIDNIIQTKQLVTKTYLSTLQCIPRPPPKQIPRKKRVKTPWSIPRSLFASYKVDNEALLTRCFENDWNRCKITKIIKNTDELQRVKKVLRVSYKTIREVYKYFSSYEQVNGVPCIGTNVFADVMNQCNAIDSQYVVLSDVDIEMVTSNAGKNKKSNPMNPERSLVRYQIIEMITRIALRLYQKSIINVKRSI